MNQTDYEDAESESASECGSSQYQNSPMIEIILSFFTMVYIYIPMYLHNMFIVKQTTTVNRHHMITRSSV
jgi:hypothetical protein